MHAVLTGPIQATLTLSDGTAVDVTPGLVFVETPEHAAELADLIGEHYARYGHPHHDEGDEFVHVRNPEGSAA